MRDFFYSSPRISLVFVSPIVMTKLAVTHLV